MRLLRNRSVRRVACLGLIALAAVSHAGPVDNAIIAAMKLPEARNYRWTSTVQDDARFYPIEGRTEIGGYTWVSMPVVAALRRRLGAGNSDPQTAIFKGPSACVIQTPDGWKTPAELAGEPSPGSARSPRRAPSSSRRSPGGGGAANPIRYSNLQRTLSHPHEEIEIIVSSHTAIAVNGGEVTGTLSETGAKLLLVHPGQDEITPLRASGTFKLWIKGGALTKYEVRLSGVVVVETASSRREMTLNQTVITELHDLGTTKFEVPEEARRKLEPY
jgi:hypothetical protein